ncbi:MAG TPA: HD domain-containing phosphohydrolase [Gemmatimonadaceae bacterium]|nr:HD domain-containing phosphohydrolase [Gemmatimonadaceae bacterium]
MAEPARFLASFAQALATMMLYRGSHPARERAIDGSYQLLRDLQAAHPTPQFSFLGGEVLFGQAALRDMKEWDWGTRLNAGGVQRLEFVAAVDRDEYEGFLEDVLARLTRGDVDSAEARPARRGGIRFGTIGLKGEGRMARDAGDERVITAGLAYALHEEIEAVEWLHEEVGGSGELPLVEAEAVVRSLSLAMHSDSQVVLPLLQLKEFDQYTTTHSLNVSVLTMGLAESLGLGAGEVRTFGVAGLLHDLGKVRIPKEILVKPGKLTDAERHVMQQHPADGARIIFSSDKQLDLAAVVAYEHHIMINGQGYPTIHYRRDCHRASKLVHVCDVYDALRTTRPYREAWESERALTYIEERAGIEFDREIAHAFVRMVRQWDKRVKGDGDREGSS